MTKPMGRPRRDPGGLPLRQITVKVTEAELAELRLLALQQHRSLSELIRMAVLAERVTVTALNEATAEADERRALARRGMVQTRIEGTG